MIRGSLSAGWRKEPVREGTELKQGEPALSSWEKKLSEKQPRKGPLKPIEEEGRGQGRPRLHGDLDLLKGDWV